MKRVITILSLIFINGLLIFSQDFSQNEGNWQTLSPSNDIFSAQVSGSPSFRSFKKNTPNGLYTILGNKVHFFIISNAIKEKSDHDIVLKFFNGFNKKEKAGNILDFEYKKIYFSDDEGFFHYVLILQNKTRIYIFQAASEKPSSSSIQYFFSSLRINDTALGEASDFSEYETAEDNNPKTANDTSQISNNQADSGNSQSGSRGNSSATPSSNANETKPITLTEKPSPSYTEVARYYEIQGNVILIVIFKSDGTIGTVTPRQKLPFGLTTQAINAAKKIKFAPAIRNGVPYNVAKQVNYSFTIY